ncbi:tryptophan synthase subunit alpha [Halobacteriales archaeon SW_5_70_135]|nr:MAG: tryptophan synthase subunit alpha [Halobacteriales archaeon SW_5_70_135]
MARAFAEDAAFVPYLVAGDPSAEATVEYVEALVEGGADAVELGLPFSEPIAEGATIQEGIVRALEGGMTPERYFELVERIDVDAPIAAMTYYNLILQHGSRSEGPPSVEPFVARAAEAGVEGVIVPDLPVDEADPLRAACDEYGLDLVFIVAPTTTDERLAAALERVSGYLYVQARLGTTGAREETSDRTAESLARLEDHDRELGVPTAVGFGVSAGEHARRVTAAGADGVIVGSALVDVVAEGVERGRPTAAVADELREYAAEFKRGAVAGAGDGKAGAPDGNGETGAPDRDGETGAPDGDARQDGPEPRLRTGGGTDGGP